MRSLGWDSIHYDSALLKAGQTRTERRQCEDSKGGRIHVKRQWCFYEHHEWYFYEHHEWCFYEPETSRHSWNRFFPCIFRESTALLTPWFPTSGLCNHEKIKVCWSTLVVQRLRLHPPNTGGLGLVPGQGTRSHMPQLKDPSCLKEDPACHNSDPPGAAK